MTIVKTKLDLKKIKKARYRANTTSKCLDVYYHHSGISDNNELKDEWKKLFEKALNLANKPKEVRLCLLIFSTAKREFLINQIFGPGSNLCQKALEKALELTNDPMQLLDIAKKSDSVYFDEKILKKIKTLICK